MHLTVLKQPQKTERHFLRAFVLSAAALIAVLLALRIWPVPADAAVSPVQRGALDRLPSDDVATWKLRHALEANAYDVGLFGNSRTIAVGAEYLPAAGNFYNFSVGGMSVRQSIAMLDELTAHGKAPRLAIIGMDYVELGLPGVLPVSPGFAVRTVRNIADVLYLLRLGEFRSAAVLVVEIVTSEWRRYTLMFNPIYIHAKLQVLGLLPWAGPPSRFHEDGSRSPQASYRSMEPFSLRGRPDRYPLLEHDIADLARIQTSGTRIILFETALYPAHMNQQEQQLSDNALAVRKRLAAACTRHHLRCLPAPILPGPAAHWEDDNHPFPDVLGPWIDETIRSVSAP